MKKHKFSHSIVEHHGDGSHTIHLVHESNAHNVNVPVGPNDVKSAAGDHDSMVDHLMDHTSDANEGEDQDENEEQLEEAVHPGIHAQIEKIKKAV